MCKIEKAIATILFPKFSFKFILATLVLNMQASSNYIALIDKVNAFIRKYYLNNLLRGLIFLGAGIFSAYITIALL